MNDEEVGPEEVGPEEVGSVGEEAAKLFAALQDWAKESGSGHAASAASAATGLGAGLRNINEHVATGGQDCVYCPVCRGIELVRQTSPEVKAHLAVAASSLLQAAAGLLEARAGQAGPPPPGVQKIDLDGDDDQDPDVGWDESDWDAD